MPGLRPFFLYPKSSSYCPEGSLGGRASGMSVERLGLIVVGMLVLLVLVLVVSAAMACGWPCH